MLPAGIGVARIIRQSVEELPVLAIVEFRTTGNDTERQQQVLAELVQSHHLDTASCTSVIRQSEHSLLLVEAPTVEASELKAAVRWRVKELIDFHIDDAVIDVFDIPGQEERGRPRMMYVVVSRVTAVQKHIDLLESSGAHLTIIDTPELALRNITSLLPEDNTGVAMLRLNAQNGSLLITRQNSLYLSRDLETGVEQLFTEASAVPQYQAGENEMELNLPDDNSLPPGLQHLLDNIVLEVQRSLDYYESHFSLPSVSGLVIAPMEKHIPGMMAYIASQLGVPVRMLDLNNMLDCPEHLSDELQAQSLLAIGAALRQEAKVL